MLRGLEGAEIALRGVIDRVDSDGAGHLRVIDYKTGSKKFTEADIAAGRALQTALYAWVVETLMPAEGAVVETCYRHTGSRFESGSIKGSSARENEVVLEAGATAVQLARTAMEGWFPAAPSRGSGAKACDERCDYLGLCRVTRHGVRKAQRAGRPLVGGGQPASSEDALRSGQTTPLVPTDGGSQ
jgi:RecB family exonuclease